MSMEEYIRFVIANIKPKLRCWLTEDDKAKIADAWEYEEDPDELVETYNKELAERGKK